MKQLEKENNALISIITPAYNSERFISETITSVQRQTYPHWEMIIVDDGSTDRTPEIVASYQKRDPRIKLYQLKRNSGPAIARNTAMEKAKGRFIAFLDSDDLWLANKLEDQLRFMLEKNIAFSFTEYRRIKENGEELIATINAPKTVNYESLLKHCVIGCLTVMLDTKKTGKVKMVNIPARQDYVLWLSIMKRGILAYGLPQELAKYRLVRNSISSNKIKMAKQNWKVYRSIEKKSFIKSLWYFSHYIFFYVRRFIRSISNIKKLY